MESMTLTQQWPDTEEEKCSVISIGFSLLALVSDEDVEMLSAFNWRPTIGRTSLYVQRDWDGPRRTMHSMILPVASGRVVDHKNGNGLDNRRSNLREATVQQNQRNARKARRKNSSSKYKGVRFESFGKRRRRWSASIHAEKGVRIRLGSFFTEEEAAIAYDIAAKKHFGEFARLNFN